MLCYVEGSQEIIHKRAHLKRPTTRGGRGTADNTGPQLRRSSDQILPNFSHFSGNFWRPSGCLLNAGKVGLSSPGLVFKRNLHSTSTCHQPTWQLSKLERHFGSISISPGALSRSFFWFQEVLQPPPGSGHHILNQLQL